MKKSLIFAFCGAVMVPQVNAAGNDDGIPHWNYDYKYPTNINLLGGNPNVSVNTRQFYFEKYKGKISFIGVTPAAATALDPEGFVVKGSEPQDRADVNSNTYFIVEHFLTMHGMCRDIFRQAWGVINQNKAPEERSDKSFEDIYAGALKHSTPFCAPFQVRYEIGQRYKDMGHCAEGVDRKGRQTFCGLTGLE